MKFHALQLAKALIILMVFISYAQAESRGSQLSNESATDFGAKLNIAPKFAALANQFVPNSGRRGNNLAKIGWTVYENKKDGAEDLSFKVRAGVSSSLKNPRGGLVFLLDW